MALGLQPVQVELQIQRQVLIRWAILVDGFGRIDKRWGGSASSGVRR